MLIKTFQYKSNRIMIFPNEMLFIKNTAINWLKLCNHYIKKNGKFFVALSGGSTPLKIYKELINQKHLILDVSKIFLFWSDERCVPLNNDQSNYYNAISILSHLNIPKQNIFYMSAEQALETEAENYENIIKTIIPESSFDLIMLGVGEDGHTASLFPNTKALNEFKKLVTINDVPQKGSKRMTLTYPCFKKAKNIYIFATSFSKSKIIKDIFIDKKQHYPISKIISNYNKNTWFLDAQSGLYLN